MQERWNKKKVNARNLVAKFIYFALRMQSRGNRNVLYTFGGSNYRMYLMSNSKMKPSFFVTTLIHTHTHTHANHLERMMKVIATKRREEVEREKTKQSRWWTRVHLERKISVKGSSLKSINYSPYILSYTYYWCVYIK